MSEPTLQVDDATDCPHHCTRHVTCRAERARQVSRWRVAELRDELRDLQVATESATAAVAYDYAATRLDRVLGDQPPDVTSRVDRILGEETRPDAERAS